MSDLIFLISERKEMIFSQFKNKVYHYSLLQKSFYTNYTNMHEINAISTSLYVLYRQNIRKQFTFSGHCCILSIILSRFSCTINNEEKCNKIDK